MKCSMELGGNAPFIVFDDADLDAAVEGAILCKFRNNGQTCVCANRIYVQAGVYDAFAAKLKDRVSKMKVGDGLEEGTDLGPLINPEASDKVQEHIKDAVDNGAEIILGNAKDDMGGNFFGPTIVTGVTQDMKVAKEEIIGLLEALRIFVDEDEDALNRHYSGMCQQIVDALIEVPGLRVSVEHDEFSYLIPHALMTFGRGWNGPSRNNVLAAMENGEPSIFLHTLGTPDEIAVDPTNLDQGELEIVIRRLREELVGS